MASKSIEYLPNEYIHLDILMFEYIQTFTIYSNLKKMQQIFL